MGEGGKLEARGFLSSRNGLGSTGTLTGLSFTFAAQRSRFEDSARPSGLLSHFLQEKLKPIRSRGYNRFQKSRFMPINQDNRSHKRRLTYLKVAFVLAIGLLLARQWFLSIVDYRKYQVLADRNQFRTVPLPAPRGLILDRNGRTLVQNTFGFALVLFRNEAVDYQRVLGFLEESLGLDREHLERRVREANQYSLYEPVVLQQSLSLEDMTFLLAHQSEHPELGIIRRPRRIYEHNEVAAHLLGYVGEISSEELQDPAFQGHRPGDIVGKFGIERSYNRQLAGRRGEQRILVDSRGKMLQQLQVVPPVEGEELHLTIDLDLQLAAEEALGESPGAVVALDPRNGEILALVSHPGFDPNAFARRMQPEEWQELVSNPLHPLQNRAIQSLFSPGSIFKLVVGLAGLEEGVVNLDSSVYCTGSVVLYGHPFHCWYPGGHGRVRLVEAIQHSCNVYFYLLGQQLGIDALSEFSRRVGLGQATGIDLAGEASGLVPSREWKKKATGNPWYAGETISVAIGQGPINVTPLQLARAVGTIATGKAPQLRVVRDRPPINPRPLPDPHFKPENLKAIREGMWRVVNRQGTGAGARVEGLDVCGKTGTVQTISTRTLTRLGQEKAEQYTPHAWFVGFASRDDPAIVVAVIVQRGGSGGHAAAPIAGKVFRAYQKIRTDQAIEMASLKDSGGE